VFYALFAIVVIGTFTASLKGGPRRAVAIGWIGAAFLMPYWLQIGLGSLLIDIRTGAVLVVLALLLLKPVPGTSRITLADVLIAGIVFAQIVSQYEAGSFRPLTLPEICRKWVGPYLMGRTLLSSTGDISRNISGIARIIAVLSVLAVGECFLQINFLNTALGRTFGLLEAGEGYRWGLKRAHVTFDHPIFFGMALVLLLPWAIEAARLSRAGEGPRWWRYLPFAMAGALFATVSRGPQIAAIATTGIYLFFRIPKLRIPFLVLAIGGGFAVTTFKDELVELLAVVAGEKSADTEIRLIFIEGEEVEYTGTNHRVLLFRVYDAAMSKAGLFGFGTELKGVEVEEHLAQRFSSIDCHYLLFYLQHGKFAIAAFLILTLSILLNLTRIAFRRDLPQAALAAGLCGALLSVAVLLMSVWFSPDFAGIWLFSAGLAGRLHLLTSEPKESDALALTAPAALEAALPQPARSAAPERVSPATAAAMVTVVRTRRGYTPVRIAHADEFESISADPPLRLFTTEPESR